MEGSTDDMTLKEGSTSDASVLRGRHEAPSTTANQLATGMSSARR
jgi:hypothetical protein